MASIVVFRCSPVLRNVLLLLGLFAYPVVLTSQITVPSPRGGPLAVVNPAVPITGGGLSLAVNPVTNKIYVPSRASLGAVTVIDGATNTTKTLTTGTNPTMAAVNPVTNKIYVTDQSAGTVIVIDGSTDTVTATVPVGIGPFGLAVNPVTNKVYVANLRDAQNSNTGNTISVIDGASDTVTATVTVATGPYALAVNP